MSQKEQVSEPLGTRAHASTGISGIKKQWVELTAREGANRLFNTLKLEEPTTEKPIHKVRETNP